MSHIPFSIEWVSKMSTVDVCHGIPTVAPANTMLYEQSYDDYEIVGNTAVQETLGKSPPPPILGY